MGELLASLWYWLAPASIDATKRVPTQTASAPKERAIANPRPSKMPSNKQSWNALINDWPPAAITGTGRPVKGDLQPLQASTTFGMRTDVGTSPVCPPPSPPWAMMTSAPEAAKSTQDSNKDSTYRELSGHASQHRPYWRQWFRLHEVCQQHTLEELRQPRQRVCNQICKWYRSIGEVDL